MNGAVAGLYLGISERSFQALARRTGLRPVDLGIGVVRWRKQELDGLLATLPRRHPADQKPASGDAFEAAVAKSAGRRARRNPSQLL
jgi:hypothetical protein